MLACSPTPRSTAGRPHRPARYRSLPQCNEFLTCPSLAQSSEMLEIVWPCSAAFFLSYFIFYLWQVCKGQWLVALFIPLPEDTSWMPSTTPPRHSGFESLAAILPNPQWQAVGETHCAHAALKHQGHPPADPTKQELAIKSLTCINMLSANRSVQGTLPWPF